MSDVFHTPPTEAGAADRTVLVTRGAARHLGDLGFAVLGELTLPDDRRADLVGLGPGGEIVIVEVKSCRTDFLTDAKWRDYLPWCERFWFAVDADFPREILPPDTGLIIADGFGGAILRDGPRGALAPARRKALTLRFARAAAFRAARPEAALATPA